MKRILNLIKSRFYKWKSAPMTLWRYTIVASVICLVFLTFKPGPNLLRWSGILHEQHVQKRTIRDYRKAIYEMDERIMRLNSDRDTLEKFAREYFHMAEPEEDVYIIVD